jgi:hypothetical protein
MLLFEYRGAFTSACAIAFVLIMTLAVMLA